MLAGTKSNFFFTLWIRRRYFLEMIFYSHIIFISLADVTIFSRLSVQTNLCIFLTIFIRQWVSSLNSLQVLHDRTIGDIKREMFNALALCGRYGYFFIDIEKVVFEIRLHNTNIIETRLKSIWVGFRVYFMEDFSLLCWTIKKQTNQRGYRTPFYYLSEKDQEK